MACLCDHSKNKLKWYKLQNEWTFSIQVEELVADPRPVDVAINTMELSKLTWYLSTALVSAPHISSNVFLNDV